MPRIDFVAEAERCPRCGGALTTHKTRTRTVITLAAGAFQAREVSKRCDASGSCPIVRSDSLARLVRARQRYGYDRIVHTGLARYLRRMQREEIREELHEARGIELSAGSVSSLCDRFLVYLGALHLKRAPQLRAALEGGYPMHLDATCERGKGGLFLCMNGWRNWVLWAARIASENADLLTPLVQKVVDLFGMPIATVRDMGDGGACAVKPLREQGVPDLICHYHFLAAVGNRLFDTLYSNLRGTLRHLSVRTDLRALLRVLRRYKGSDDARFGPGRVRTSLAALILWLLEDDGKKDPLYPFSLAHLDFVRRCREALSRAEKWVPGPRTQPERRALAHLGSLVGRLERDSRITPTVAALEERWRGFCELRDVLRITNAELPRGDARYQQVPLPALELLRLEQIKAAVDAYRADLEERVPASQRKKPSTPAGIILKYLDRYGANLFGHPALRDDDGHIAAVVQRTNNIPEHFFGDDKQRLRRRLGRANLGSDLEQQPAQAALVANLRHPSYVQVLCGSLENLAAEFALLDQSELQAAPELVRDHRDKELQALIGQLLKTDSAQSSQHGESAADRIPPITHEARRLAELAELPEEELRSRCAAVFPAVPERPSEPAQEGSGRQRRVERPRDRRLPPPGTVLRRTYRGKKYRVRVLDEGFEYRGDHYTALSTIANVITGSQGSNGFHWFGLRYPYGEEQDGRRRRSLASIAARNARRQRRA